MLYLQAAVKTKNVSNPAHMVTFNSESRHDLHAWTFLKHWRTMQSMNLYTDAAGALGFWAMFGKKLV